ncbi:histidine kinase [Mucilaginibacter sp. HD30]
MKKISLFMERIKKLFVLIHIVVWMLFSAFVTLQLKEDKSFHWLNATLVFLLTDLYVFYSHFFLLTRYGGKRKRKDYFLRLTGVVLTGPFVFALLHYADRKADHLFYEYYGMALFTIVPIFIFLGWLARVTENLVLNTIRKEQLEKQAVEAELYYLKSQINPHFLFNTLNNIHTLVYKQAPAAPEAVMRLASLMRYMIYESNAQLVPLSREIDYLKII